MRKNGFTLVELLGVLVIIGILSAISVAIYTNSINSSKNSLSDVQKRQLEEAARTYVAINTISFNSLFDGTINGVSIHVRVLNHAGLLQANVFDPKDMNSSMLDSYVTVVYDSATNQYIYKYNTDPICEGSTKCNIAYCMKNEGTESNPNYVLKGPVPQADCEE